MTAEHCRSALAESNGERIAERGKERKKDRPAVGQKNFFFFNPLYFS